MDPYPSIIDVIARSRNLGERRLANGTLLVGHVPHVAPEAWLHEVYQPLADELIAQLENELNVSFPDELRSFYRNSNGIGLFSGGLSIFGKRFSFSRSGDDVWQPFCLVTANTLDRPETAKPWQLFVGSYEKDGSLLSIDLRSGEVIRTRLRSSKKIEAWPGFWIALISESLRLSSLYDESGRIRH